jgi:uncharacterized membrane-anchored protein
MINPAVSFALHPDRTVLHNEVHARPPEALHAPMAIAHVVMLANAMQREASREHLTLLLRDHHLPPPCLQTTHLRAELGRLRLRWELHTEFVTWTFSIEDADVLRDGHQPLDAITEVPGGWLAKLPGQSLCNLHLWVVPGIDVDSAASTRTLLHEETLVGSWLAGNQSQAFTDFAIHADGFSRMLLLVGNVSARRLGRLVQRLLEIETYRMAAMLGLPAARQAAAVLASAEGELAALAQAIRSADRDSEPVLLDRLTKLAAQVESQHAATHSRFSASRAYFELIDQRVEEIEESPLEGLQTIGGFVDRRLAPARKTCEWAAWRQDALSQRISRTSNLLRTRVEIEHQQSSQALLAAMNVRQDLQLKLQSTVEGLSVAAITYYIVGLVGHLTKGANQIGWPFSSEATTAVAIPIVVIAVWLSLLRLHKRMFPL